MMAELRSPLEPERYAMMQTAVEILDAHRIMTVATVRPDGWPQATIVGYANEGLALYFLIYRNSQKFVNMAADDRVAITVGEEPHSLREITAVYAGCRVAEVTNLAQRSRAWNMLAQRHPNLTDLAPPQQAEVATMVAECRYLSILDYSKGLGHSETVVVERS
jgi:nitroimidazol reductase NimA-like FMN-containing flavoprotein (pyridoxamine 5'-phosphate oxidase superfamily)